MFYDTDSLLNAIKDRLSMVRDLVEGKAKRVFGPEPIWGLPHPAMGKMPGVRMVLHGWRLVVNEHWCDFILDQVEQRFGVVITVDDMLRSPLRNEFLPPENFSDLLNAINIRVLAERYLLDGDQTNLRTHAYDDGLLSREEKETYSDAERNARHAVNDAFHAIAELESVLELLGFPSESVAKLHKILNLQYTVGEKLERLDERELVPFYREVTTSY